VTDTRQLWCGAGRGKLVLLIAALSISSHAAQTTPLPVEEVASGVFLHLGKQQVWSSNNAGDVANVGFVVGRDCVAVIDSGGSPDLGRRLLAAVRAQTPLPVCYVINTHAHPDHILGNVAFAGREPPPRFVAHTKLAASLRAREPFYREAVERELNMRLSDNDIVYPDLAVESSVRLDLGDRTLVLRAWPTAHTDHDLTVLDERTGTLFLGDLLFIGHLPVLDGRLIGWLAVMDELATLEVRLAVPGHGPPDRNWPAGLTLQRAYLTSVRDRTRSAIADGMTISATVASLAEVGTEEWLLSDEFHQRNLTAAYAELEWED